jgi:Rps23 Pro-64 3,4-dihydroxylase Tpa1-like proline 4-hydroxylase
MINPSIYADVENLKEYFISAKPFPYVVIDNFFDQSFYKTIVDNFYTYYDNTSEFGKYYNTDVENGKWTSQGNHLSDDLLQLGSFFQSIELKSLLSTITGFKTLNTASFNTKNVGFFHLMKNDAYLGPHIDHMMDMDSNHLGFHVLNIIVYITKEWNANWGGHTFFTDKNHNVFTDVEYKPNRAVIFMHSPISIHGTNRITSHANNKRISIYFDFYSNESNPYEHLGFKFRLHKSPHLFFLPNIKDYFKKKNRKYLLHFLSHYKNKIQSFFIN